MKKERWPRERSQRSSADETIKGKRWMPRRQAAKKDVVGCEKLREAAKQALIRRCPNGETQRRKSLSYSEYIAVRKQTQGTETSQYLKEEKETSIPPVAASEQGRCLNRCCVKDGSVAAPGLWDCAGRRPCLRTESENTQKSWKALPERVIAPLVNLSKFSGITPEYGGTREILLESAGTTLQG